jgi:hypothetical protein
MTSERGGRLRAGRTGRHPGRDCSRWLTPDTSRPPDPGDFERNVYAMGVAAGPGSECRRVADLVGGERQVGAAPLFVRTPFFIGTDFEIKNNPFMGTDGSRAVDWEAPMENPTFD